MSSRGGLFMQLEGDRLGHPYVYRFVILHGRREDELHHGVDGGLAEDLLPPQHLYLLNSSIPAYHKLDKDLSLESGLPCNFRVFGFYVFFQRGFFFHLPELQDFLLFGSIRGTRWWWRWQIYRGLIEVQVGRLNGHVIRDIVALGLNGNSGRCGWTLDLPGLRDILQSFSVSRHRLQDKILEVHLLYLSFV